VKLQVLGTARIGPDCIAYAQRFNTALLVWEFDHFLEYGVEVREDRTMEPAEKATVRAVFESVARQIEEQPRVLTHRDFHSRNVMVHGADQVGLIDFQDALMGPWTYDLASLLRDAYVTLGEDVVDDLITYFLAKRAASGAAAADPAEFRMQFDLCSVQRNLKAAGRFVFIDVKKGNDKFLRHIPPVLGYVRRNLQKYEMLHPAFDVLQKYVPEFQV
jgi:N-acetylmuramate 1-kinase